MDSRDAAAWQRAWQAFQSGDLANCRAGLQSLSSSAFAAPQAVTLSALVCIRTGETAEAERLLRSLIDQGRADAATYVNLGELLRKAGRLPEARDCLQQAVRMAPQMAQAHYNLGTVLGQQGDDAAAIASYQTALTLQPNYPRARFNLANSLLREGRCYPARDHFQQLVREQPQWAEAWQNLGAAQAEVGDSTAALDCFRRAAELSPQIARDCEASMAGVLLTMDSVVDAAQRLRKLAPQGSAGAWRRLQADLLCSAVQESAAEIDETRTRAHERLEAAVQEMSIAHPEETPSDWFEPPMQWAYHGEDDRPLKTLFAQLYLPRIAPIALRPSSDRPHAAFVVTHGHEGVFARCLGEILRHLPNDDLRVSIVCPRATANTLRFFAPQLGALILEIPADVAAAARFLAEQRVDLLYYWEIGTDAFNYLLPFWRPAAVQCTSWGWPITTGNPRVDVFLTSRRIEPPDAENHFTERCVWIDGPLTIYPRPAQLGERQRDRFGFTEHDRVYMCQQNLRKWHPDFDHVLRDLLAADERAKIACIGHTQKVITEKLLARLRRTIPDLDRRMRVFPFMDRAEYLELLRAADVSLDTPRYGGGANTLADAFAVGTPVVTWEGAYHRSRFASAVLRQAGANELVATSLASYVTIAQHVATEPDLRATMAQRLSAAYGGLFENSAAVNALRDALLSLIASTHV